MIAPGERRKDRCSILRLWWWPAAGALSCEDVWWTRKFDGPLLFVVRVTGDLACGEMQEEHVWNQQEVFNLRAQVAAESGLADAVRAINILATAQVRKDNSEM